MPDSSVMVTPIFDQLVDEFRRRQESQPDEHHGAAPGADPKGEVAAPET